MDLQEFLGRLLPAIGRYVVWYKTPKFTHQKSYPTLQALQGAIEALHDTPDIYYATAAFHPDTEGREAGEVLSLKAHRIDIDAGEKKYAKHGDKVYPTKTAALHAVRDALKGVLPHPTLVVGSGEGLHLYWELSEAVPPDEWKPTAERLKALCTQIGLRQDAGVTTDMARVLRPVGSLHNNGTRVEVLADTQKVWDNDTLRAALDAHLEEDPLAGPAPVAERNINDDVLNSVRMPPASLLKIANHCGAVAELRDSGGNVPEPQWRLIIGLAKYCETDGRDVVHMWSRGYDGYDERETDDKYNRWDTPPPLCKTFSTESTACKDCKHWGKIVTPKQLGYVEAAPAPAETPPLEPEQTVNVNALVDEDDTTYPVAHRPDLFRKTKYFPYHIVTTPQGARVLMREVEVTTEDDTGAKIKVLVDKPVTWRAFWVESATSPGDLSDEGSELLMGRLVGTNKTHIEYFRMPAELMGDPRKLAMFLFSQGINLAAAHENNLAALHAQDFVRMDARRVQEHMKLVIRDHFGYRFHEGHLVCSLGGQTVHPDGVIRSTLYHDDLQSVAQSLRASALPEPVEGEWKFPDVWTNHVGPHMREYVKFIRQHYDGVGYEVPRLAIALGLASPLMAFMADTPFNERSGTPALGLVVTLFSSKSGSGKTSVEHVIAAGFGQPSLVRQGNATGMTEIAGLTMVSSQSIFPFLMDEVSTNKEKDSAIRLMNLIYQYGNGESRIRARNTGAVVKAKSPFACITFTSTNVPQRDMLAQVQRSSDATQMRMLELSFEGVPNKGEAEKLLWGEDLKKLYASSSGAFGLWLALKVVKLGITSMNEHATEAHRWAMKELDMPQQYRFFVKALGAIKLTAALMGKEYPFDLDDLVDTFKKAVMAAKMFLDARGVAPQDLLEQMIGDLAPHIVVTKTWGSVSAGTPVIPLNPEVRHPLAGREVQDEGAVYLNAEAIRRWCMDRQASAKQLIDELNSAGLLVRERRKVRITTGIANMVSQSGWYYKFKDTRERAEHAVDGDNVVPLRPEPQVA